MRLVKRTSLRAILGATAILGLPAASDSAGQDKADGNWPSFRGHAAAGVSDGFRAPSEWNADDSDGAALRNVQWKVKLPGFTFLRVWLMVQVPVAKFRPTPA